MMRCDEVRQLLEEGTELVGRGREHLARCADCQAYARRWSLIRAGLAALAEQPPPEPSLGFAARLVRRLEEAIPAGSLREDFLEFVGRRVVLTGLLLVLLSLVALVAPPSGPVRESQTMAAGLGRPEPENHSALLDDFSAVPDPVRSFPAPADERQR